MERVAETDEQENIKDTETEGSRETQIQIENGNLLKLDTLHA